jgi:antitoxin (DNA-binding transcriptional repressor) of toxin-antitoxin stability system
MGEGILSRLFRGKPRGKPRRTTMQTTMAVEDIKVTLPELLDSLTPGDEVILTRNHQPVAKLVTGLPRRRDPRKAGNCVGMVRIVADDDEHLEDFRADDHAHAP